MFRIIDKYGDSKIYQPRLKEQFFVKIYSEPLEDLLPKLSGIALKVFLVLENINGWNEKVVEINESEIVEATGMSETAVKAGLGELEERQIFNLSSCY
ncbi:MAG: hypothetical protein QNJ54_31325 [Prochloraceae cyanobacterium]|nr:hypothetical protein [Prochloraceae cyanobacterium]